MPTETAHPQRPVITGRRPEPTVGLVQAAATRLG
jgi:hypothetical protein